MRAAKNRTTLLKHTSFPITHPSPLTHPSSPTHTNILNPACHHTAGFTSYECMHLHASKSDADPVKRPDPNLQHTVGISQGTKRTIILFYAVALLLVLDQSEIVLT
jgi:hypothetical protein